MRHRFLSAICLSLLALGCAEDPSTQLVVLMDTDYAVPAEVDRILARVSKMTETDEGPKELETWRKEFSISKDGPVAAGAYGLPASFGILPTGADLDKDIVIELEALASGTGQVLVSRRVETGFVAGEARLVRMLLYRACADMACAAGESCGCAGAASCAQPSCVDESVRPEDLERIDKPGLLPADAGIPVEDASLPADGGVDPDGGVPDGGIINCEAPLVLCGVDCVNPQADPRYCGDCETSCPSGNVCEAGSCIDPGDCRTNGVGCSGFTYCEESSGECLPGCVEAQQCNGEHEVCDADAHECVCALDFERCEGACVDTQIDPDYCGNCMTACLPGQVCLDGICADPGDCRVNGVGCSGFTYCDQDTGECLRGCEDDEQCVGEDEVCDTVEHDCVCAPGFHQCGAVCLPNLDVDSCGALCVPCQAPDNAIPLCVLGTCAFVCDDTYERCDQMCCPTSCPPGQALYDGSCAELHLLTVDSDGDVGEYASLALDLAGRAQISYYDAADRDLVHAARQQNYSWISTRPDSTGDVGQYTSIAIDPMGITRIAYYSASDKDLMFATWRSGAPWVVEVVADKGDVGKHASLAFDGSGIPHISYYDEDDKDLLYATRAANGSWSSEIVDGSGDVGEYTSLAFDLSGRARISYYDADDKDLKHAVQGTDGTWRTQTVASIGNVGKHTSLAIDALGLAHITYYGETSKDLLYASELAPGIWTSQNIDGLANVGMHSSLAFDESGRARISYYDESNRDLKYAVQLSGPLWSLQTIDSQGDVGRHTSIAVDELGHAHISYYDASNGNLKYALIAAPE